MGTVGFFFIHPWLASGHKLMALLTSKLPDAVVMVHRQQHRSCTITGLSTKTEN